MKSNRKKPLLALLLCVVLSLSLVACGAADPAEEEDIVTNMNNATAGGADVVLPEGFIMPETANKIEAVLVDGAYEGVIYLSGYRPTSYVFITGSSLTVDANLYLTDANGEAVKAEYLDTKIALWEKGSSEANYIDTAHFAADGTNQTYTFENLKAGGEYRISITYSDIGRFRVNGKFRLSPVSATGSTEETAAAE